MHRQQNERQCKRNAEADPDGDVGFAESGQQHHHGANAGEHQNECGSERRKQRDVDAHGRPAPRSSSLLNTASLNKSPIMR